VFSLPWENFIVIPGVGVFSRVIGAVAVGLTIVVNIISGRFRRWHVFHVAALLFVVWAAGVLLIVYNPAVMPKKFWTFVQLLVMVWMIWELAPSRSRLIGLLSAYVLGSYVSALDTILLYRRAGGAAQRFAGGGGDPNDLAMTLAAAIPMAWYLGMTSQRPIVRWACRAYIPVGLLAIGLTGSRGGMIASLVGLLIVPLTMTRLSPGKLALAIALLAISGGIAVAYVPKTIVSRLSTTTSAVEDLSLGGRFRIWRAGIHAFAQRPMIGYGSGSFKVALLPELGYATQVAHNSYLSVLVEEGFVGLLLYLTMFIAVFLSLMRLRGVERRFALVLLATIAVAMLPLSWDDRKTVWFVLAALVGLARAPTIVWRPAEPSPQYAGAPLYRGPPSGRPGPIAVPQARRGTSR
ncbi:MAG: O-antigen ligase family protein, partial [Gemmatimonadales bacterium]